LMEEGVLPEATHQGANPGSRNHPVGCKPCNKFNPSREGSCKHGQNCEYCHLDHDRQKHRGQRGRHALQRRQYLESREDHPPEMREIIDDIYEIPNNAADQVKRLLLNVPSKDREEKARVVLDRIVEIGGAAQSERPDSSRVKAERVRSELSGGVLAEIDGRCKWLVGTLHLVVRKMQERHEPASKIRQVVDGILGQVRALPQLLDPDFQPVASTLSKELLELAKLPSGFGDVELAIRRHAEAERDRDEDALRADIRHVVTQFERLPDVKKNAVKRALLTCDSLQGMKRHIDQALEDWKQRFAQALTSDSEKEEDIEEFDQLFARKERGSTVSRLASAPGGACGSDGGPAGALMHHIQEQLGMLGGGFGCLCEILEAARAQGAGGAGDGRALERIAEIVEGRLLVVRSVAQDYFDMTPEEVERRMRERLSPNNGLEDICARLEDMTKDLACRPQSASSP